LSILFKINNFFLYLLIVTVVFEQWDPFGFSGSQSITYFTSIIYILSSIPLLRYSLNFQRLNRYIFPLVIFIIIGIISTALNSVYAETLLDLLKTRYFQLIILAILVSNHILRSTDILWNTLYSYLAAVFLLYLMTLLGYGVSFEQGRLLIFGENPNLIGTKGLMAFMIALGIYYKGGLSISKIILIGLSVISSISLIVLSGSRGALLFLLVGITILTLFSSINIGKKITLIIIGAVFSVLVIQYIFTTNEDFKERIFNSLEKGETGRSSLWAAAFDIFQDNLVLGVGITPSATFAEMYKYQGTRHYPHNIFLWVLMSTGIVGFMFFGQFLFRLARDLHKSYSKSRNILFLILFILNIFLLSKSGGAIRSMFGWLFWAILIGSTTINDKSDKTNDNPD
jgi:O-antigen ligase